MVHYHQQSFKDPSSKYNSIGLFTRDQLETFGPSALDSNVHGGISGSEAAPVDISTQDRRTAAYSLSPTDFNIARSEKRECGLNGTTSSASVTAGIMSSLHSRFGYLGNMKADDQLTTKGSIQSLRTSLHQTRKRLHTNADVVSSATRNSGDSLLNHRNIELTIPDKRARYAVILNEVDTSRTDVISGHLSQTVPSLVPVTIYTPTQSSSCTESSIVLEYAHGQQGCTQWVWEKPFYLAAANWTAAADFVGDVVKNIRMAATSITTVSTMHSPFDHTRSFIAPDIEVDDTLIASASSCIKEVSGQRIRVDNGLMLNSQSANATYNSAAVSTFDIALGLSESPKLLPRRKGLALRTQLPDFEKSVKDGSSLNYNVIKCTPSSQMLEHDDEVRRARFKRMLTPDTKPQALKSILKVPRAGATVTQSSTLSATVDSITTVANLSSISGQTLSVTSAGFLNAQADTNSFNAPFIVTSAPTASALPQLLTHSDTVVVSSDTNKLPVVTFNPITSSGISNGVVSAGPAVVLPAPLPVTLSAFGSTTSTGGIFTAPNAVPSFLPTTTTLSTAPPTFFIGPPSTSGQASIGQSTAVPNFNFGSTVTTQMSAPFGASGKSASAPSLNLQSNGISLPFSTTSSFAFGAPSSSSSTAVTSAQPFMFGAAQGLGDGQVGNVFSVNSSPAARKGIVARRRR